MAMLVRVYNILREELQTVYSLWALQWDPTNLAVFLFL
jgi:hypothetical protein